jgi:hypothetical protein
MGLWFQNISPKLTDVDFPSIENTNRNCQGKRARVLPLSGKPYSGSALEFSGRSLTPEGVTLTFAFAYKSLNVLIFRSARF